MVDNFGWLYSKLYYKVLCQHHNPEIIENIINRVWILIRSYTIIIMSRNILISSVVRGHYVSSNIPGNDISAPKFTLCLPVPYVKVCKLCSRTLIQLLTLQERALSAGLSNQLASFLLYSLSPFNPNPDILDNKDLLTELTKQYKVLESRRGSGIRKVRKLTNHSSA